MVGRNILFVDDDEDLTSLMKITLEKDGHRVDTANSYDEALENYDGQDVLISDYLLKREPTGIDLSKEVEADKSILYSGYTREFIEREQDIPDNVKHIGKPHTDELKDSI